MADDVHEFRNRGSKPFQPSQNVGSISCGVGHGRIADAGAGAGADGAQAVLAGRARSDAGADRALRRCVAVAGPDGRGYPLEIVEAARWSKANPNLKGDAAVKAVDDKTWDVSVKSLVAFPSVLNSSATISTGPRSWATR